MVDVLEVGSTGSASDVVVDVVVVVVASRDETGPHDANDSPATARQPPAAAPQFFTSEILTSQHRPGLCSPWVLPRAPLAGGLSAEQRSRSRPHNRSSPRDVVG